MRDLILYTPAGLMLDFGDPDEQTVAIVEEWRHTRRSKPGDFVCWNHRNYPDPKLYLQERNGVVVAAHWPKSGLHDTYSYGVSDEHKRQADYICRAAEAAGYRTQKEYSLPTKIRLDAAIFNGAAITGVEVQRSAISIPAILGRTTKAHNAGVVQVWYDETEGNAKWMHRVPSVGMNRWPWNETPPPRAVAATGLRMVRAVRCHEIRNGTCPNRRYGCRQFHPVHEPLTGLFVDDVAEQIPGGLLIPMRWPRVNKRDGRDHDVLLVPAESKQLYEELTRRTAEYAVRPSTEHPELQQHERIICTSPTPSTEAPSWIAPDGSGRAWSPKTDPPAAPSPALRPLTPRAPSALTNPRAASAVAGVNPWTCFDTTELILNGWQWCASQQTWFRTVGPDALSGACGICRRRVIANPPPALHVSLSDRSI